MEDIFAAMETGVLPRTEPRPAERHEPFPLTDIQQAYVIGRHRGLELGGVSSHFYYEFDAPGLDVPRLTEALRKVIGRHDMLRAVTDSEGRQRVLEHVPPYEIATTDLRGASPGERSAALERIRAELAEQVLPTDRWPLFDIRVTLLDGGRTLLHLSADLLFTDVRSLSLMLTEWRRHYDDPAYAPEPLELTFRDHTLAERALQEGPAGEKAAAYWRKRLPELPPAPDLPLAATPEEIGRPSFVRHRAVLDRALRARLQDAAHSRGLTLSALLLTAYTEVLRGWSKRQDFTLTTTLLHRPPLHPQTDRIIGDFLAPSLLAVTGGAGQTFAERATALQQRLREDLAHTAFGGIRVLRELTKLQADGRSASLPVVFSNTLDAHPVADGEGLTAFGELVHSASQTPQLWLENQISEEAGNLVVTWNAVEGLFPPGVLEAMFDAHRDLLGRLAGDDAVWERTGGLVPLPAAQAEERRRANDTAADIPPRLLHELVGEAAARRPDAVAVLADGEEVTYRHLTEDAHRLGRRLRESCGAEPNRIVAVSMRPGAAQISAILGVLHSGAAYVAIDPELPEQRRLKLLRQSGAEVLVTEPALREGVAWPEQLTVVTLDDEETRSRSAERPDSVQGHDDLAYVIFTSGSTGEPKGVMISHRSAANTVQDINRRFGVGEEDRVLALAPTNFDLSVYDIFGVLGAGGAVVVPDPRRANDVTHWSELVDRHAVTLWNSVPAPMRMWADALGDAGSPRGNSLRLALLSGDWIPTDLPDAIRKHFPAMEVISLGGATEGSIWSIHYPIGEVPQHWRSIPYGKPLANQTMHVLNDRLEPCPTWVTGEIHIGGTGVALGYWGDATRTAERFIVHPATGERLYKTGDLGRYLPGGDIEILGREDFQVKINGYRVELGEIEAVLDRQAGVRHAVVTAPAHPRTGQRQLAAYLVPEAPGSLPEAAALREAATGALPGYMVPSHYITIDALPLTANGKIDRSALPAPWSDGEADSRTAPRDAIEERLLALWSEQLGHDDFGTEDGFFDVGGDSLHAVGIIGQLRAEFGIGADAEQEVIEGLFMNATVSAFADIIRSIKEAGA
ncbi:amino acid adenylation domain-containing protein [Streptomyces sp. NPDC049555]|uniref:non-ribosomal peptide synthetase n=1 Tax=Streptomyces sp. NPDC049555 TaxID=3154930 RepID=UPI0034426D66